MLKISVNSKNYGKFSTGKEWCGIMKKFLSIFFAIVLAAGAVTGVSLLASAANGSDDDAVMLLDADVTVTSWDELKAAISLASSGDVIALENDIEVEVTATSSVQYSTVKTDITVDLCGHTINVTGPGYYTGPPTLFSVAAGCTFTLTSSAVDENEQPINGGIKTTEGTSTRIVTSSGNTANQNNLTWNISNIDIEGFGALNYASMPYALIWYNGSPTETDINLQNVNFKNNNCICISITQDDENTGSTVIKSCSFEDNKRTDFRWSLAVYLWKNNAVEVTDSIFTGNGDSSVESTSNGSVGTSTIYSYNSQEVTISGCDFENNITENGGAFYLLNTEKVTIKENTVKGNISGNYGGGFRVYNTSGPITITKNTITENEASERGGAFYLQNCYDEVSISENKITSNKAGTYAGGVYITTGTKEVKIENNEISGNKAADYAGGIYMSNISGKINIDNNTVTGNSATFGGGMEIEASSGNLTLTNNTVTGNTSTSTHSGGFYVTGVSGKISVQNNTISENESKTYAGGFCMSGNTGTITVSENEIKGNKASSYYAGFYLDGEGNKEQFEITGNTISENRSSSYGCGMGICDTTGAVNVEGNTVTNNTGSYATGIYMDSTGAITLKDNTITGNIASSTNCGGVYITNANGDVSLDNNTISQNTANSFAGGVYIKSTTGSVDLNNNTISQNETTTYAGGIDIDTVSEDVTLTNNKITGNKATTYSGGLYITGAKGNVLLDENTISSNTAGSYAGGAYIKSTTGTVDFKNNTVSKNEATTNAGGFYMSGNTGKITVAENEIENNKAGSYAAGFYLSGSGSEPFEVTGNTVSNNIASSYAGGMMLYYTTGEVNVKNNTIEGNTATSSCAGGIYMQSLTGETNVEENAVKDNTATYCGGMMLYNTTGEVNVKNNTIEGNTATSSCAGGIYMQSLTGEINVEKNTVKDNTATYGGGIYITETSVVNMKNNTITGNKATTYYGGGLYTASSVNSEGDLITGNTTSASGGAGGVFNYGTFTMTSGAIYGNTANGYAADIYNYPGCTFTLIEAEDMDIQDYTVKGWYNDAENERYVETENPAEYTVKSNDTTEQSLIAAYGYTLSYDAGLGKGTIDSVFMDITKGEESVTVSSADGMTKPNGYCRFGSWNKETDGSDETSYSQGDEIQLTENTTLYAQWEKHNFSTEETDDETDEDGYKYIEFNWCDDNDLEHLGQITCTATFTCTDCDYTETKDCGVTYEHDEYATCTDVGDYDVKATAHITNPRDDEELTATMDEFFEEIALGHDYGEPIFDWEWDETNEEWTCATATLECSRDDTEEKTHSLKAECTVTDKTTAATCTEKGETVYTASVTFTDDTGTVIDTYTESKTVEIDALGHDYGEPIFAWDWDETNEEWTCATATLECSRDDTEEKTHSHTEECTVTSSTTDATCTEKGKTVYTATVHFALDDNDSYVEPLSNLVKYTDTKTVEIDALGHTPSTEVVIEKYIAPTCETKGSYDSVIYCEVCGEEVSRESNELDALGHSYGEGVVTKEATCTEVGELTYTCQNDESHTYTEEIPATGHTEVTDPAVEPTCTEAGLTEGSHCSVCGAIIVAQEEVNALGHAYDEGVVTKEATCTEAGELTYTCRNDESHTYTEEIPATGHTEVTDAAVEPTCTETGLTEGSHCSVCGEIIIAQEEIPALGHNLEYVEAKASSATISGNTEYWYCKVCNRYYADEACTIEISLEDTVIPPTGLVLIPVEVTEVETGEIITVYFDENSGIYYADSEGTIIIHPDSIILHDGSISVTEEPTTEGVTEPTTEDNTSGSSEGNTGTVNESNTVQIDEDEDTEDEEEPDEDEEDEEDEEKENGVKTNGSSTSPATGMATDIVGGGLSLACLVAVFAIVSRRNKKHAK